MSRSRESVRSAIARALGLDEHVYPKGPGEDRRPQWLKDADGLGKATYDEETGRRVGAWARAQSTPYRVKPVAPLPRGSHAPRPAKGLRKPPKL